MPEQSLFRIAAMSDIHYGKESAGHHVESFSRASEEADVLLLCGDLTDYGLPEEVDLLLHDLQQHVNIPILAVLGNHDYESGQVDEVCAMLEDAEIKLLDGSCTEIGGVGFAGTKGFAGGFGRWALSPWGEPAIKAFVQESVDEELKLEAALARLNTPHRVVLLHYAPIRATVEGEPEEIIPYLGSSRLAEPLDRFQVTAAFHGHAHAGAPEGQTVRGVPIYNVSVPVLEKAYLDKPPFRLIEINLEESVETATESQEG